MTFKEWLNKRGMSMHSFGKLVGLPTSTISNLARGKPVMPRTVKKLVRVTKKYPDPITHDMFPRVYQPQNGTTISGVELFKLLLSKKFKK